MSLVPTSGTLTQHQSSQGLPIHKSHAFRTPARKSKRPKCSSAADRTLTRGALWQPPPCAVVVVRRCRFLGGSTAYQAQPGPKGLRPDCVRYHLTTIVPGEERCVNCRQTHPKTSLKSPAVVEKPRAMAVAFVLPPQPPGVVTLQPSTFQP